MLSDDLEVVCELDGQIGKFRSVRQAVVSSIYYTPSRAMLDRVLAKYESMAEIVQRLDKEPVPNPSKVIFFSAFEKQAAAKALALAAEKTAQPQDPKGPNPESILAPLEELLRDMLKIRLKPWTPFFQRRQQIRGLATLSRLRCAMLSSPKATNLLKLKRTDHYGDSRDVILLC